MQRDQLAIHGTEGREGVPRVEIVLNADGQPDLLHPEDGGGRFARVIRGFVGAGHLPQAVAIKLERDEIDPAAGAVKFISEYQAQIRVHEKLKDGVQSRVVRLFEMWKLPAHLSCDELPPTILCPRSRQVLPPRCPHPECGATLRDDLSCGNGCPDAAKDEILRASRCPTCMDEKAACPAYWLNARVCKILLLELLDLDLEQYLKWRWSPEMVSPPQRAAWRRFFHEHLPAIAARDTRPGRRTDATITEFDEWGFLLGLFADALDGVRELHVRQIAHLDLKPANLCLALDGANARLKVIDLGQADNPLLPWNVRLHSIHDDAEARRASGAAFWAPEQLRSRFVEADVMWRRDGASTYQLLVDSVAARESILQGDVFCFPTVDEQSPILRVTRITVTGRGLEVGAFATTTPEQMPPDTETWRPLQGGCFVQNAGKCADVFALGLMLVYLLGRGRIDVTPLREHTENLTRWLRKRGDQAKALPPRALVDSIADIDCPAVATVWRSFLAVLPEHAALRELIKELLGAALQAFVRGVPGFSYAQHRGDDSANAAGGAVLLDRFRTEVTIIRNRLKTLAQTHELHDGRISRLRRFGLNRCLEWLKEQPSAAPAGEPPPYDRTRISGAIDLLSADETHNQREFRLLLRNYRGVVRWLRKDLILFNKELKAGLTTAQMHPVVLAMFEVVSPATRNGKPQAPANPALQARDAVVRGKAMLLGHLAELSRLFKQVRQTRRWYVTDEDVARLEVQVQQIAKIVVDLNQQARYLKEWHDALQAGQKHKIIGWERLELGGAGSWHEFGQRVIRHMHDERRNAENWSQKVEAALERVRLVLDLVREQLVQTWPARRDEYRASMTGSLRRLFGWVQGQPLRVPLHDATTLVTSWLGALAAAEKRTAKIGPPPFNSMLHEEVVLPPKKDRQ